VKRAPGLANRDAIEDPPLEGKGHVEIERGVAEVRHASPRELDLPSLECEHRDARLVGPEGELHVAGVEARARKLRQAKEAGEEDEDRGPLDLAVGGIRLPLPRHGGKAAAPLQGNLRLELAGGTLGRARLLEQLLDLRPLDVQAQPVAEALQVHRQPARDVPLREPALDRSELHLVLRHLDRCG